MNFEIVFTDHENPKITCPVSKTVNTEPRQAYAAVSWTDPQVTDNSGQILTVTCNGVSGSRFEIGETEVSCQAIDLAGNRASCVFLITIKGK